LNQLAILQQAARRERAAAVWITLSEQSAAGTWAAVSQFGKQMVCPVLVGGRQAPPTLWHVRLMTDMRAVADFARCPIASRRPEPSI